MTQEQTNKFTLPTKKVEEKKEEEKQGTKASPKYTDLRGRAIIRANGSKMVKVDGGYTPENAEEEALCIYFQKLGYLQLVK